MFSIISSTIWPIVTTPSRPKTRFLIVVTSSTRQYAGARAFSRKLDLDEEARIREFYGRSDDKVTFWKSLVGTSE